MIRHIVFWNFPDEADGMKKAEIIAEAKRRLETLPAIIPELKSLEFGVNCNPAANFDAALVTVFESLEALGAYQVHPAHQAVSKFIGGKRLARATVDYEF